jgi:hypothetical protein
MNCSEVKVNSGGKNVFSKKGDKPSKSLSEFLTVAVHNEIVVVRSRWGEAKANSLTLDLGSARKSAWESLQHLVHGVPIDAERR